MKKIIPIILFRFISIAFCDAFDSDANKPANTTDSAIVNKVNEEGTVKAARQEIYNKLKNTDFVDIDAMIRWIEEHSDKEAGIDNLEKIQISLLQQERYDEATMLWAREYAKEKQKSPIRIL